MGPTPPPRRVRPALDVPRLEFEVPVLAGAVPGARAALELLRLSLDREVLERVRLVVSELLTNAIGRAELDVGDKVNLLVVVGDDVVHIEVTDQGRGFDAPAPKSGPDLGVDGGFGLLIVDRLARAWGVEQDGGRTRVWAELDAAPPV